jgi:excisionase family DNA binding protein
MQKYFTALPCIFTPFAPIRVRMYLKGGETMSQHLYKVSDVADILKVNTSTVWRWIKAGKLSAFRTGRTYRMTVDSVWISSN